MTGPASAEPSHGRPAGARGGRPRRPAAHGRARFGSGLALLVTVAFGLLLAVGVESAGDRRGSSAPGAVPAVPPSAAPAQAPRAAAQPAPGLVRTARGAVSASSRPPDVSRPATAGRGAPAASPRPKREAARPRAEPSAPPRAAPARRTRASAAVPSGGYVLGHGGRLRVNAGGTAVLELEVRVACLGRLLVERIPIRAGRFAATSLVGSPVRVAASVTGAFAPGGRVTVRVRGRSATCGVRTAVLAGRLS